MNHRRNLSILTSVAFAAVLLTILTAPTSSSQHLQRTITLQPGLNVVGWLGGDTPVADLFADIPRLQAVFAWDAVSQHWRVASPYTSGTLHSLNPNGGLFLRIGGDRSVQWTTDQLPSQGRVELYEGFNLVVWAGRDDTTVEHAVKGIGHSFESVSRWEADAEGWRTYHSPGAAPQRFNPEVLPLDPNATVQRGDVLWVASRRPVVWLQPTGITPSIEFPGITMDSQVDTSRLQQRVRSVLDQSYKNYAIEADFSTITIYFAGSADALVDALEIGSTDGRHAIHSSYNELRGWVTGASIVLPVGPEHTLAPPIGHEYLHVIQNQLRHSHSVNYSGRVPEWFTEGSAEWLYPPGEEENDGRLARALSSPTLSLDDPGYHLYSLGAFAVGRIVDRTGDDDAWVEIYRRFGWEGDWERAFREVARQSVAQFKMEFREWLKSDSLTELDGYVYLIHVRDTVGVPVEGVYILLGYPGYYTWATLPTSESGTAVVFRDEPVRAIGFELGYTDSCKSVYSTEGFKYSVWYLYGTRHKESEVFLPGQRTHVLDVVWPDDLCAYSISGQLSGELSDIAAIGADLMEYGSEHNWELAYDAVFESDRFYINVPTDGDYVLSFWSALCDEERQEFFYQARDRFVRESSAAQSVSIDGAGVTDIDFVVTKETLGCG